VSLGVVQIEWYIAQYACLLFGFICVPVHYSHSIESLRAIAQIAPPKVVFCSAALLCRVSSALKSTNDNVCVVQWHDNEALYDVDNNDANDDIDEMNDVVEFANVCADDRSTAFDLDLHQDVN
jgi:acyl-CoA synthetase (AMP-forming)/AMP-acid ligase II